MPLSILRHFKMRHFLSNYLYGQSDAHLAEHLLAALDADPHAGAQGGPEALGGAGHGPRLEVMVTIPRPGRLL